MELAALLLVGSGLAAASRVMVEPPNDLRRYAAPVRYTLVAAFCWLWQQEIVDALVDLPRTGVG